MAELDRQRPEMVRGVVGVLACDPFLRVRWVTAELAECLRTTGVDVPGRILSELFEIRPDESYASRAQVSENRPLVGILSGTNNSFRMRLVRSEEDPGIPYMCMVEQVVARPQETAIPLTADARSTIEAVIAGFAHEVRNPLAAILSLTELAIDELRSAYVPVDGLMRIPGLVGRVERLIQDALNYSRPAEPQPAVLKAEYVVRSAARLLVGRFPYAHLEVAVLDDSLLLYADRTHVEQVLFNLIQNACEAACSRVVVTITPGPGATCAIVISDDGSGVPDEWAARIFDPFVTTKARGTGLGLAIARNLARLNGGDVRLECNEGGATFLFSLPIHEAAEAKATLSVEAARPPAPDLDS